jgi:hypothetical protein
MINVEEVKSQILEILNAQGPLIPLKISRQLEIEPIFTSAILSELLSERRIITSNMRIGSSPLYLLPGQENQIENFIDNISGIQKTALLKLKQNKILEDEKQEPAIRVALRSLKDFAIPLKLQEKIIWKYFTLKNNEIKDLLNRNEKAPENKVETPKKIELVKEEQAKEIEKEEPIKNIESEKLLLEIKEKKEIKKSLKEETFLEDVKNLLLRKDIEFIKEIEISKKELNAIVRINSDLGKLNLLLVAKNKKRIAETDIIMAYQKAIERKMACLFVSYGEPSKKINEFLEDYKNIIKIDKIE